MLRGMLLEEPKPMIICFIFYVLQRQGFEEKKKVFFSRFFALFIPFFLVRTILALHWHGIEKPKFETDSRTTGYYRACDAQMLEL